MASGSAARGVLGQRDQHPVLDVGGGGPVAVEARLDAVPRRGLPGERREQGTANSSKMTAVASGYPGSPMTGAIPAQWSGWLTSGRFAWPSSAG